MLLMGRVTYEVLAAFSATGNDEVMRRMTQLDKVVFSNRLEEPLAWKNSGVARGSLNDEVAALKRQPGAPLRSIGSVRLVKASFSWGCSIASS